MIEWKGDLVLPKLQYCRAAISCWRCGADVMVAAAAVEEAAKYEDEAAASSE